MAADRRDYLRDYKIRLYVIIEGLFGIISIMFPWSSKFDVYITLWAVAGGYKYV